MPTDAESPVETGPAPTPRRSPVQRLLVTAEDSGQRLDKVLARLLGNVPRSHCYRLLRKGEVRVNGRRATADQRLAEGDELRIPPLRIETPPEPDAEGPRPVPVPRPLVDRIEAAIVHEDERLLVIDKPSGVAVHGGSGISFGVIEALRASRPEETLELVHRLDRDTSGCLLVARKRSSLRELHALLRTDAFDKRYLALLKGKWELGATVIDAPLNTEARVGGERTVRVDPRGKSAASRFRVVQFFGRLATLVEVELLTGRTHQIRVHAAHAGHPVAGDEKYGDPEFNAQMRELGLRRLFLHSHSVTWPDGRRQVDLSISAPLAPELRAVIDRLGDAGVSRRKPAGPPAGQRLQAGRSTVRAAGNRPAAKPRRPRSAGGR